MGRNKAPQYERRVRRLALTLAVTLHLAVVALLGLGEGGKLKNQLQPLAILEFAYFDPEGAKPGGGNSDELIAMPELKPLSPATTEPETDPKLNLKPKPELSPKADQISELDELKIIESVSAKATPLPPFPPPQPLAGPKPKPKPKTKSQPRLITASTSADAGSATVSDAIDSQTQFGYGSSQNQGGTGGGSGHGNPNALNAYKTQLLHKLNRYKKYPPEARSQRVVGTVLINFTVNRQGAVLSSYLARSSGNTTLNQEALALLRRVSPFPPIPKEITEQTLNITAPIQFTIDANSPPRNLK